MNGLYLLKQGGTIVTKINNKNINHLKIDNDNNIYISTNDGVYVLKQGTTTPTKINGINDKINFIIINKNNNVAFYGLNNGIYTLKNGETTATKIKNVDAPGVLKSLIADNEDNFYFSIYGKLSLGVINLKE